METQAKPESVTEKILDQLKALEIDVAVIKSNGATREDLAQMEARMLKWFFGTAITLAGLSASLAFVAAKFIH